jgi:GntR family uxuAB operon transcriptional repressor
MQRSGHVTQWAPRRRYAAVAQRILGEVAKGRFQPGDRLPADRELAASEGVSRATVREALLALELVGVVQVRHGEGVYVLGPGARVGAFAGHPLDVPPRELIETRQSLEPSVAALCAVRMRPVHAAALREQVDQAAALADNPAELTRFVSLGLRFHAVLAAGCGNGLLADIVRQLVDVEEHPLWALVNQQAMRGREAREGQVREHLAVIDAVAAGDGQRARELMRAHVSSLAAAIFPPLQDTAAARATEPAAVAAGSSSTEGAGA